MLVIPVCVDLVTSSSSRRMMSNERRRTNTNDSALPPVPFPLLRACLLLLLLLLPCFCANQNVRHCTSADLLFQYTACDQNNNRWLFAVPRSHSFQCTAESMPPPRHGLNCTVTCPAGQFLELQSQQCQLCQPGSFSLGDRVRYEQFESEKLPDGFSVENTPDQSFGQGWASSRHCPGGGGWAVEDDELRYQWTHCVSTLSISLHLVRPGFAEFQYQLSKDSRGLVQMLQVRNAQCQSYGNTRNPLLMSQQQLKQQQKERQRGSEEGADIRVQRLALRRGQNLITWTVAVNPVLSSRMEMIRLIRLDISGLAFSPVCTPCPAGTFSMLHGAMQCDPCADNEFAPKGASRCQQCPPATWAGPHAEFCLPRLACSSVDFFPVRPSTCNASKGQDVYQRKISPQICLGNAFTPETSHEPCPACGPGMQRDAAGKCVQCPQGQVSANGETCTVCPQGFTAERGLFLTRWDSTPPGAELKMECEFLSAEETPNECRLNPSWISHGDRLESVQTRMRGVALELSVRLKDGFYAPLHSGKASPENPLGHIALDVEMQCRGSCQLYVVQEFDATQQSPAEADGAGRQLQMLALLNGTQSRRLLRFPVVDPRPRRLLIAFTRSGALLERDELGDKAILFSLNATNAGSQQSAAAQQGSRCVQCPRVSAENGQCLPCPAGNFWAIAGVHSSCHRCPPGHVVNHTALELLLANSSDAAGLPPLADLCQACPPHFEQSADGFSCEFSGHFDIVEEGKGNKANMYFDLSALKETQLTARGIRVFSRDGQSYQHHFNISLFPGRPVRCRDSLMTAAAKRGTSTGRAEEEEEEEESALFCRAAAIPLGEEGGSNHSAELFVSSAVLSHKLALITRHQQFGLFQLSDEQLEYESSAAGQRPLDVHFFYEPLPALSSLSNCPNGTAAVATVRCEPTALAKPLVRFSRRCPDGTCDGCLYHAIVESAHGCPVCTAQDYREIRGECVNDRQRVHSIPAKHCILSGAQAQEREEPCRTVLSSRVWLVLATAVCLILLLLLIILYIYRRNKSLECRYMRLVEGREMDSGVRSCALGGSDQEGSEAEEDSGDEDGPNNGGIIDSARARVFFNARKTNSRKGQQQSGGISSKYSQRHGRPDERAEFIAEEESD